MSTDSAHPSSPADSHLADGEVRLLRLFACAVLGRWDELAAARRAAPPGEPNRAWRETLLMVHVYAGAPRAVECHAVLARAGGLGTLDPGEVEGEVVPLERGEALFDAIYASSTIATRASSRDQAWRRACASCWPWWRSRPRGNHASWPRTRAAPCVAARRASKWKRRSPPWPTCSSPRG
jgi:hypothetical protein